MAKRITETELILPSLYLMSLNGGVITTSELIQKLRDIMKPSGEDLQEPFAKAISWLGAF